MPEQRLSMADRAIESLGEGFRKGAPRRDPGRGSRVSVWTSEIGVDESP